MTRWYYAGVGSALAIFSAFAIAIASWLESPETNNTPLVFEPQYLELAEDAIMPGSERDFDATLRNKSKQSVWVEQLRFSCPCASGEIAGGANYPFCLTPLGTAIVKISVTSKDGETGRIELDFSAVGRVGHRALWLRPRK